MPGGDRTGPTGAGPMTGGGFGFCSEASHPQGFSRSHFQGWQGGFGRGGGRGWRSRFWASERTGWQRAVGWEGPIRKRDNAAERSVLQQETVALEAELQRLRARIEELETSASE